MESGNNGGDNNKVDLGKNVLICEHCKTPWMETVQTFALKMKEDGTVYPAHAALVHKCSNCNRIVGNPMYVGEVKQQGDIITPGQSANKTIKMPRVNI